MSLLQELLDYYQLSGGSSAAQPGHISPLNPGRFQRIIKDKQSRRNRWEQSLPSICEALSESFLPPLAPPAPMGLQEAQKSRPLHSVTSRLTEEGPLRRPNSLSNGFEGPFEQRPVIPCLGRLQQEAFWLTIPSLTVQIPTNVSLPSINSSMSLEALVLSATGSERNLERTRGRPVQQIEMSIV
jgi:hypothetical protein